MSETTNQARPLRPRTGVIRQHRRGERGLTLIEIIITIALLTVGVVGIAGGIASAERIASVSQQQAQLEVQMRQLSDWARDSTSTGLPAPCTTATGTVFCLPYKTCATTATYQAFVNSAITAGILPPAAVAKLTVTHVYFSTSASRLGGTAPLAGHTCSGSCPGGSCVGDWGVQEITLTVSQPTGTSSPRSVTRTVWKGST
jgi:prepilin-type N-terminal cleavage/methylation domain-containing protein